MIRLFNCPEYNLRHPIIYTSLDQWKITSNNFFTSLSRILSYLSTKQLMGVARVCRRFYFLAWEPELWEKISFTEEHVDVDR